jgi:hypothetical protein
VPKPPGTWKQFERDVCMVFGLKRRGADYGDKDGGKTDAVNIDGTESHIWAVECKFGKRLSYKPLLDACRQVEAAARDGQEPIVVAKMTGERFADSLVVMRLETFREWRLSSEIQLEQHDTDDGCEPDCS